MGNSEVGHLNIGAGRVIYQVQVLFKYDRRTFKFNVLLMIFPISTDNNQPKLPHPNVIWFYTLSYYKLQHHKYLRPNLAHLSIDIVKLKNIRFQRLSGSNRWKGDSLKADPWVWITDKIYLIEFRNTLESNFPQHILNFDRNWLEGFYGLWGGATG